MNLSTRSLVLPTTLAAALLASGCFGTSGTKTEAEAKPATTTAATAPASKVGPGMNERGEVTDPRKVEAGYGQKVKGIDDWEGEITGKPVPGSKFSQLQIGMSSSQVLSLLGQPSDQGAHMTGNLTFGKFGSKCSNLFILFGCLCF